MFCPWLVAVIPGFDFVPFIPSAFPKSLTRLSGLWITPLLVVWRSFPQGAACCLALDPSNPSVSVWSLCSCISGPLSAGCLSSWLAAELPQPPPCCHSSHTQRGCPVWQKWQGKAWKLVGSTFLEGPSGAQESLFPVTAQLPGEEQVCYGCGALSWQIVPHCWGCCCVPAPCIS